jgi:putative DNA primase/helicase
MSSDAVMLFRDAMRAAGIVTDAPIVADGRLHRVRVEGDRRGKRSGWYVLHLSPVAAGAFGHWRTGACGTWRGGRGDCLSPAEQAQIDAAIAMAREQRQAETQRRQDEAKARAARYWAEATPADAAHPYLAAKRVKPHGTRCRGDLLLVPMRDADGALWSVQTIAPDGNKRFLAGSRKRGLYHSVGGPVFETLLVAEGFATGASLHEATALPVAVAFDAGNLEPVALALRGKFPNVRLIVCADDDAATAERIGTNPGLEAAERAAQAAGGYVARPDFSRARGAA